MKGKRIEYLKKFVKNTIDAYRLFLPPNYVGCHPNEHGIRERISELEVVQDILNDPELED